MRLPRIDIEIPLKIRGISVIRIVILVLFIACMVTTGMTAIPAAAQSPSDWIEYINNPVFGQWLGGEKSYYPKVIYDANQFSGYGNNAYYKMWFQSSSGIGYAYSDDGINWTIDQNPVGVLASGASHPLVKYDSNGFGSGVYYKLWYWDPGVSIYTISAMRYAESADGVNWTNDQTFTQDGSLPLVTGNWPDWNDGTYGPCDIIYNQNGSISFDDGNLLNNKYVLYYMGNDGNHEFIGLAYSNNAIHWKRYGNNPVLNPGAPADWDNYSVGYCSVMNISGSWRMWYGGGPNTNFGIGYATSPDGINWTKDPGNPIYNKNDGMPWRNDRTYTPWVVYDGSAFGGHGDAYMCKMWFTGRSSDGKYSVGYAMAIPALVPTVIKVNPASGLQGQCPLTVAITGNNFNNATAVSFGNGITVKSFIINSDTKITANICIAGSAKPGARNVSVTTPGGTDTKTKGFVVDSLLEWMDKNETPSGSSGGATGTYGYSPPVALPTIVVQSASLSSKAVAPATPVTVTATVTNRGGSNGTSKVTLFINGQEAESKGITLASGESAQLHFGVSRNEPGTYSVYVNGVPAGNFTVDLFTSSDILIYSVIGLFTIGIIGVLYLVIRKRAAYS